MTAADRHRRTLEADLLCRTAWSGAAGPETGVALVAVGGYGRGELAPHSDLDVVLVHDDQVATDGLASTMWYPLWDSGLRVDHSVRSFTSMVETAEKDLRVALGLLDVRHLAGDPNLTLRVRTTLLAQWRRSARRRLPELAGMVRRRHETAGELGHSSVPDLKESGGGLRDACVLKALVATWLVDVPHPELERGRRSLLDVRDQLHELAGRPGDRVAPELWAPLADRLGLEDAEAVQRHVRRDARRIAHLSRMTWRRVEGLLAVPTTSTGPRRPRLRPVAPGLAVSGSEVVLDGRLDPAAEPLLLLRAAAEAAERGLVLGPATVARLVAESPALPEPWPEEARRLLVRLLAAGRGLFPVWEVLEETEGLTRILPEWDRLRLLPHASAIHRYTVDRHVVETCVEASALIRRVARPDLLVVAALLHDIGKGSTGDHSVAGAGLAAGIAARMGFEPADVEVLRTLVRWHLLLPTVATSRDVDDPATVDLVAGRVGSPAVLELLAALTEADARATSEHAWSGWRARLVGDLVGRTRHRFASGPAAVPLERERPVPEAVRSQRVPVTMDLEPAGQGAEGARLVVMAPDRVGLLADVAGALVLQRAGVRAARAWTQGETGVSEWEVSDPHLDAAMLRQRFDALVAGRVGVTDRPVVVRGEAPEPVVVVHPEASRDATVLEVRAADGPRLLHTLLAAVADLGMSVRSAHVDTLGPQAVVVLYLQEVGALGLGDDRAASAAHALRAALAAPSRRAG